MRTLLILIAIVSLSLANLYAGEEWQNNPPHARMSDAKMKALLIGGTWHVGDQTYTFTADGKWIYGDNSTEKWDVQDGQLIEIRGPVSADRPYTIVFLTKHECLIFAGHHEQGYAFWWR